MNDLKVAFIVMKYPVPSETFISNDIQEYKKQGVNLKLFTLLQKHDDHKKLVVQRGLDESQLSHSSPSRVLKGFILMLLSPVLTFQTIFWVLRHEIFQPSHGLKCLSLLPISFTVLNDLKMFCPDVVHLLWGHYPSILGYLARKKIPKVVISQFLGAYDLETNLKVSHSLAKEFSDVVWTHARVNVPKLINLGIPAKKIQVAYRGINIDSVSVKDSHKEKVIISAGRLIPEKGFDTLLHIFKKIYSECHGARLKILGDGPLKYDLRELSVELGISDSVEFLGHLNHSEVFQHMANSKIFILLSSLKSERLPNVIKEAMLSRCYCLTTESTGIDELVQNGETGFVLPVQNTDSFASLAVEILRNEHKYTQILDKSIEHIQANFDRAQVSKTYITTWANLC